MIRLDLNPEPHWLELAPDLRVKLAPLTTALMAAARADPLVEDLAEDAPPETQAIALAKAIARLAILDWEGVGDAEGAPLPPSPAAIDALLELYPVFEAFQTRYVAKGLLLDAEKNASAPAPTGTSAGAKPTARPAKRAARPARTS